MRVESRLADVEFKFGPISREGNSLVLRSAPDQTMESKVYVSPADVVSFLGKFLTSRAALTFLLAFPLFYLRARREPEQRNPHSPW